MDSTPAPGGLGGGSRSLLRETASANEDLTGRLPSRAGPERLSLVAGRRRRRPKLRRAAGIRRRFSRRSGGRRRRLLILLDSTASQIGRRASLCPPGQWRAFSERIPGATQRCRNRLSKKEIAGDFRRRRSSRQDDSISENKAVTLLLDFTTPSTSAHNSPKY